MTPVLHRPWNLEHRRDAPVGGERRQAPPPAYCDECGRRLNTYNSVGRCGGCCTRVGYPADPPQRAPRPHTPTCQCYDRRYPHPTRRHANGTPVWVIDVTCPDCGEQRTVAYAAHGNLRWCDINYTRRCQACAAQKRESYHQGDPT